MSHVLTFYGSNAIAGRLLTLLHQQYPRCIFRLNYAEESGLWTLNMLDVNRNRMPLPEPIVACIREFARGVVLALLP